MFKLPKGQIHWETQCDINGKIIQIVTSDELRRKYYLYNVDGDTLTKIETNDIPIFQKRINGSDD